MEEREELVYNRQDFWATTSNKQLNFVQHIRTLLKSDGKAAVVVPDNVLFFDNHPAAKEPWTREVWIYDYRTNVHHTLKKTPLTYEHLADFIACYKPTDRHKRKATWNLEKNLEGRWRKFTLEEILSRDRTSLDITWIKDTSLSDSDSLPDPADIARDLVEDLEAGLESFRLVKDLLNAE